MRLALAEPVSEEETDMKELIIGFCPEKNGLQIKVNDVAIILPLHGTMENAHDSTKNFLEDLLSIEGVEGILKKHGVTIERK